MKLAFPNISFDKDSKVFGTFYVNNKKIIGVIRLINLAMNFLVASSTY